MSTSLQTDNEQIVLRPVRCTVGRPCGTARITDCDITLEYNDTDYEDIVGYFDQREWGSGNMITLAAMTIGNKSATLTSIRPMWLSSTRS